MAQHGSSHYRQLRLTNGGASGPPLRRLLSFVGFTIAPSPTTSFATAVLDFLLDIPIAVLFSTGSLLTGADASAAQNLR
jgi:hypothetical protein